tara:strand:- start:1588 stop:1770 length:183 start_codon:yes stop_codon:yes gene_type:complete
MTINMYKYILDERILEISLFKWSLLVVNLATCPQGLSLLVHRHVDIAPEGALIHGGITRV